MATYSGTDLARLTPGVVEGLRQDNEVAKLAGWQGTIGVDDVDLLLDAAGLLFAIFREAGQAGWSFIATPKAGA